MKKYVTLDRIIFLGVILYFLIFSNNPDKKLENRIDNLREYVASSKKREKVLMDSLYVRNEKIKRLDIVEDSLIKIGVKKDIRINRLVNKRNEKGNIIINKYSDSELVEFFSNITIPEDRHD